MIRQPANLDVLFRFASVASQTGDLEGAISALERMLLINANLPRVRLELGAFLLEVDLLLVEEERLAALAERRASHAEHAQVPRARLVHVLDRHHHVIDVIHLDGHSESVPERGEEG